MNVTHSLALDSFETNISTLWLSASQTSELWFAREKNILDHLLMCSGTVHFSVNAEPLFSEPNNEPGDVN